MLGAQRPNFYESKFTDTQKVILSFLGRFLRYAMITYELPPTPSRTKRKNPMKIGVVEFSTKNYPPKMNECSAKRVAFQKEISSFNQ